MRKALLICTALLLILVIATGISVAQVTSENWCFEGQPWGDGRCDNPDPYISSYYWSAGWCHAQIANGTLDMTMDECMGVPVAGSTAVDDIYRSCESDKIGCLSGRMEDEYGLLVNDIGEDLYIVDYTGFHGHPGANLTVRSNGAFSYEVHTPGTYTFTYTLNNGATANVTIYACPHQNVDKAE